MPSESYYECSYGTCRKRSRTEDEARAHYQGHLTGSAIVPSRGSAPAMRESRLDRVIRGIDTGSAKIRGGLEGIGKVQATVNRNFNFEAALGGADFSGNALTGNFGDLGVGFDLGAAGSVHVPQQSPQGYERKTNHHRKKGGSRKPKSITINFG